jgi:tetratricopeptide (TPR) repeat protein
MQAVISGIARKALIVDGESFRVFDVSDPTKLVGCHRSDLPYLFGEGQDLRFVEDADLDSLAKELKSDSDFTLALDLTLISLDTELEEDIRRDAVRDLDELIVDEKLKERLEGVMYARALPADADLNGLLKFCDKLSSPNAFALFESLARRQSVISEVSAAWDLIPTKMFGDGTPKADFQRVAVCHGLFRSLVLTIESERGITDFLVNARLNRSVDQLRNSRQVLQQWLAPFRKPGEVVTIAPEIEEELDTNATPRRRHGRRFGIDRQAVLREVNRKKSKIAAAIRRRDCNVLPALIDDLVKFQRENGETEHLAKSLCDLAMEAKELELFPLQLQLTERSIGEVPDDAWSWAQYGDALLKFRRFGEALYAFEQSENFGGAVAQTGRAEVLKAKGEFDAALAAYDEVISENPEDLVAKTGRAEVLKAKGDLEEALAAYERIIDKAPEDRIARTGWLSILAATGRNQEVLASLSSLKLLTLDDWIDYHILGMIHLRTGDMAKAIEIFDEGVRNDPWPSSREYFRTALALTWLRGRDFKKASQTLEEVKSPQLQPTANVFRIHAFGAQGNLQRASLAYEDLSTAAYLRSDELTQELHRQFILNEPPRKSEQWILDREAQMLVLAA